MSDDAPVTEGDEETPEAEPQVDLRSMTNTELAEAEDLLRTEFNKLVDDPEVAEDDLKTIVASINDIRDEGKRRQRIEELKGEVADTSVSEFAPSEEAPAEEAPETTPEATDEAELASDEAPAEEAAADEASDEELGEVPPQFRKDKDEDSESDSDSDSDEDEEDEDSESDSSDDSDEEEAAADSEDAEELSDADEDPTPVAETGDAELAEEQDMTDIAPDGLESDEAPVAETAPPKLVASVAADVTGYTPGDSLEGVEEIASALLAKHSTYRGGTPGGGRVQDLVASIPTGDYDEAHILGDNAITNMHLIEEAAEAASFGEGLVAAGGSNAPLTPYYKLQTLGDVDRPVKAMLPGFRADRGGMRFIPPSSLADITIAADNDGASGAVRLTDMASDTAGYSVDGSGAAAAFKPYQTIAPNAEQTVDLDATHRQLEFGVIGSRTFPEQVQHWTRLSMVAWARRAESYLLSEIKSLSTDITLSTAGNYSATRNLLNQITDATVAYKSRHRISANRKLSAIFPWWVKDLLRKDLAMSHDVPMFSVTDAQIAGWFSERGIVPTYHLDDAELMGTPTQIAGAQASGTDNLVGVPTTVDWALFESGSFLHLDGGTLDLGVVRDTATIQENNFRIFAESWEAVAHVGVESLWISSTLNVNGKGTIGSAT